MLSTDFVPGMPNWMDIGTPDIEATAAFYGSVFGWTLQPAGPDPGGYGFFTLDDEVVAGIGPLTEEGAAPSWTLYFQTADADATARAVEQAGGTVRVQPDDVSDQGRLGAFTDPSGAEFAVWEPRRRAGLEKVMDEDTLCWTELYTTDAETAKRFYRSVFSWTFDDGTPDDSGMSYSLVSTPGGGAEGDESQGGIMQLPPENLDAGSPPEWHPYLGVTDCDATYDKAVQGGARTLIPPVNAPGVGRLAMMTDPHGAVFAIIKGDPEQTA